MTEIPPDTATAETGGSTVDPPQRLSRPSPFTFTITAAVLALAIHGLFNAELRLAQLVAGVPGLIDFASRAFPPDIGRTPQMAAAALQTFEIALIGTALGAALSVPVALTAARNTSPHPIVYAASRGLIAFIRSIPDLVWGLIFVVSVGLGPLSGILAIAVDVVGFCGRFFAERMEEVDPGPATALRSMGASSAGVMAGAIIPASLPSFVATTLFALEGATRSAVVLGLVGAGGIGVELETSMQLFRYDQAMTAIIIIFLIVALVERTSAAIRDRII